MFVVKRFWTEIRRLHRRVDQPKVCARGPAGRFARWGLPLRWWLPLNGGGRALVVFFKGPLQSFKLVDQGGALGARAGPALFAIGFVMLAGRHVCCPCTTTKC
jgi:hypothetical protein